MRSAVLKLALTASALCICAQYSPAQQTSASSPSKEQTAKQGAFLLTPLGDEVGAARNGGIDMPNPQASNPAAVRVGEALFRNMNCAYCHGLKAKGVMGPSLTDGYWRYGGTPVMIFKSIAEGRPEGMPAWGKVLGEKAIWDIVAYIESLGGAYASGNREAAMDGDLAKGDTKPGAGLLPMTQGSY
jgi:cytochrome c oxidase cbb3-type subunit 3